MSERASIQVTASGGGPRRMARIEDGEPVWQEVSEEGMASYMAPPSNKYRVRITGIGETWTQAKRAEWIQPGGPTEDTMTRLEFEILEGKGKGKQFTSKVNCVVNPRSNLGQVWLAAVGPIPPKAEITDLLGKELVIYVEKVDKIDENGNKRSYANPTWKTAKAVGAESDSDDEWPAA
jgi:hypothetical protein